MEPRDSALQAQKGKIANIGARVRKHGCLLVALAALLIVFALLPTGSTPERGRARRYKCHSNLKSLLLGVALYSGDEQERFPPNLDALFPAYASDGWLFLCPSVDKATALTKRQSRSGVTFDGHTDYVYVSGLMGTDPPEYIVMFDDEWNHAGEGVTVARVGGHIEWLSDFRALYDQLDSQEKALAAQGRKMTIIRPPWSKRLPSFEAAP